MLQQFFQHLGLRILQRFGSWKGPPSFDIENLKVSMAVNLERELSESDNVVGVLPKNTVGDGDEQMVLLGAHYDHLGYGIEGSSLARKDEAGKVFMGADDNASGVAAVLSIAQELALQSRTRDVAFAFWSGEELGLLGSEAFVESKIVQSELKFDWKDHMAVLLHQDLLV